VGQDDMTVAEVRARVGGERIIGLSVETGDGARAADAALVDYAGIGPVFPTATKPEHAPAIGFDGLAKLVALSPVPVVAIGGLKVQHAAPALMAGAHGIAVVSAICGQPDPRAAAAALVKEIRRARA
jgi:thiamine-phosphate pyrophosphorylase